MYVAIEKREQFHVWDLAFYLLVLCTVLLISACAIHPQVQDRGPLIRQRLQFRPGQHGLVNQTCAAFDEKTDKCIKMDVKVYDLRDAAIRQQLIEVNEICSVGGDRYRICAETPGLCRQTYVKSGFLGLGRTVKLLDVKLQERDAQSLLNLNTWCAPASSLLGQTMFLKSGTNGVQVIQNIDTN